MLLQENTLFANRYQLERLIGRGGFSEVWLAKDNWTHLHIVIKVYAPGQGMDTDGLQEFCGELAKVFDLNHTNLLKPSHVDSWEGMPYLIMAYCSQGSISKYIGRMPEDQIWQLIHDVASGLAYLHKNDIVHQDIKPDNILIDDAGNFVITDFGISTKARSTLRKSVIGGSVSGGTMAYMGPERFSKQPAPTKASDIWSFGAMIYELIEGNVPFGETGGVFQKAGAEIPEITAPVSDKLKQLVCQMLSLDTWDRPTAEQLINGTPSQSPAQQVAPHPTSRPTVKWTSQPDQPQLTQQQEQKPHGLFAKMKESCKKRNLFVNIILFGCLAFLSFILIYGIYYRIALTDSDWDVPTKYYRRSFVIIQCIIALWGILKILKWEKDGISIMLLSFFSTIPLIFSAYWEFYDGFFIVVCLQYVCVLLLWLILLIPKNGISTWKQCKDFSLAGKIITGFCIAAFVVSIVYIFVFANREVNYSETTQKEIIPENYVLVPGGTLLQFKNKYIASSDKWECIDVPLDSFYICKCELTQKEFTALMPDNPSPYKGDSLPAMGMSLIEMAIYCNRLSEQQGYPGFYTIKRDSIAFNPDGRGYRLPTKYEWVYAARDRRETPYRYASGDNLKEIAWYGMTSNQRPHKVATKKPNLLGLYDMTGNVEEMVWDDSGNTIKTPTGAGRDFYSYNFDGHQYDEHMFSNGKWFDGYAGCRLAFIPRSIKTNNNIKNSKSKKVFNALMYTWNDWKTESSEYSFSDLPYGIGRLYEHGYGVKQDMQEAQRWYDLAAKKKPRCSSQRARQETTGMLEGY